tara:strand:- start:1492 stop:1632 length:141 start_codon:yes stop_codon:yes gene_type:complete
MAAKAPAGNRTQITGFKVPGDNHYTTRARFPHGELNPDPGLERAIS